MFSFFRKKRNSLPDLSYLTVDMHSHLIPNIDDGAKTIEDSITMILQLKELGFQKIITTPHIMGEYYPNTPQIIRAGLKKLTAALAEKNIDVEIEVAAEYYLDDYFIQLLESGERLLTLYDNFILVEFSMLAEPVNALDMIFQLKTKGYQPVLAHPERYLYFGKQFEKFKNLKTVGCDFQLNLLSLSGYYGLAQKKLAIKLLGAGLVDFLGTDLHRIRQIQSLGKIDRSTRKMLSKLSFKNPILR
ncbi:MAG: CpsB/CapC family capsule biosynthesis tyrosine phosphatase [Bacteroidota bacterium]